MASAVEIDDSPLSCDFCQVHFTDWPREQDGYIAPSPSRLKAAADRGCAFCQFVYQRSLISFGNKVDSIKQLGIWRGKGDPYGFRHGFSGPWEKGGRSEAFGKTIRLSVLSGPLALTSILLAYANSDYAGTRLLCSPIQSG